MTSRSNTLSRILAGALSLGVALPAAQAWAATPQNALVVAWNIDAITTFDPAQNGDAVADDLFLGMCDALVDFDPADESSFVPRLAESWSASEDGKTVTFKLRDNLVFPDGSKASATDIAWSIHRVAKLKLTNAATLQEYGFDLADIENTVTAPDDKTVVMNLSARLPLNLLLGGIAANRVAVALNRKVVEANAVDGDMGNKYLATNVSCVGPYSLTRWTPGEGALLTANENYAGEKPALKQVIIRHISETGTQRLLLEKGDVDVARNLTPEDLADLGKSEEVRVEQALRPSIYYFNMNNAYGPFSNEKVRLAMRYLIDYQGLGDSVLKGIGIPRASFVQLGAFGALDKEKGQPFKLDIDKAKQLLTEAGYPNGFEVSLLVGSHPYGAPIAQSLQANAAKVGVTLNIERMSNSQLFSKTRARDFQSALLGYKNQVPDAHGMASRHIFNPDNREEAKQNTLMSWRSSYFSETANKEVANALAEPDTDKRKAQYIALQEEMMQTGPQAFIFQQIESAGVRNSVKHWAWNGFRTYLNLVSK